ncbi:8567_t:CDS:2 [Ambispora gerdemannii]|uniref:8567_t:CDS:1 n=1 Tax=Ambispora gerdemannii TaxID=144530 RepID=A0A9N9EBG3_9GLOM|nr:8567_t:CDS:2 [Ambispora gerdemannii]
MNERSEATLRKLPELLALLKNDCHGPFCIPRLDVGRLWLHVSMEQGMKYMGTNLAEGLMNYLFRPDNIRHIMEITGELVSVKELKRHTKKRLARNRANPQEVLVWEERKSERKRSNKNR